MLLYYITDRAQFPGDENARHRALLKKIAEAADCGVDFVQLREKDLGTRDLESLAYEAVRIVHPSRNNPRELTTRLLVNSRTDVAIACRADGVHLRSDDVSTLEVRKTWAHTLVSVSCHSVVEVARAAADGADLAIFGPVFEKKDSPRTGAAGLGGLLEACRQKIPVLALGGITLQNARACIDAGAAGIAAIRLFQENDIAEVVERLRA